MRRIALISILIALLMLVTPALAQDGIPDNCETAASADVRNLIPRFDVNHSRLTLADWRTGDTMRVLGEGLRVYRIRSWSPECRYLAIAEGDWRSTDTVVYDVESSVRMGSVPDAAVKLHPITWGPDGYLMVESRHGAVLWHVPSGRQSILTDSFNYTRVRNFVQIIWDAPHHQVLVTLAMGGRAAFDLETGAEIPLTGEAHALLDAGVVDILSTAATDSQIDAAIRVEDSFTSPLTLGVSVPIVAEVTSLVADDLIGELTVTIEVPDEFDISEIRIDPAQDYTDIRSAVNSVRTDGEMRTIALHDPDRLLTIEYLTDDEDQPRIRLTWVSTEGLTAANGARLRIDFKVIPMDIGIFTLKFNARMGSEDSDCPDD